MGLLLRWLYLGGKPAVVSLMLAQRGGRKANRLRQDGEACCSGRVDIFNVAID